MRTCKQRLYQANALEIAKRYEQALEDNSIRELRKLLHEVVEPEESLGKR